MMMATSTPHIMSHTLQGILAYRSFVVAVYSLFVVALALFTISVAYVLYIVMRHRIRVYRSPLRSVPGPRNAHWVKGNFVDVPEENSTRLQEEWVKTYGHVLKYHSLFGVRIPFQFPRHLSISYSSIEPKTPGPRLRSHLIYSPKRRHFPETRIPQIHCRQSHW
jgi:hypothetical protein